ncbi:hypothetical protein C0993_006944 [Termitomyces sp. T159_Od127]|nr:hypothetical protein C0993_006944 [Termitomyces sp. T159_Od127]
MSASPSEIDGLAPMSDIDAQGLEKLGYKQELSRSRGLFHILFSKRNYSAVVLETDLFNYLSDAWYVSSTSSPTAHSNRNP